MDKNNYILPVYGQFIWIEQIYVRKNDGPNRIWKKKNYKSHGIFLGPRTIKNGRAILTEDGGNFRPTEHFLAAFFSPGPNRKPMYVPLDAIKI
jgi:hypothetical protein